jgi:hypothetical protein
MASGELLDGQFLALGEIFAVEVGLEGGEV